MHVSGLEVEFSDDWGRANAIELHCQGVTLCSAFCRRYFPTAHNEEAGGLPVGVDQNWCEGRAEILYVVESYLAVDLVESILGVYENDSICRLVVEDVFYGINGCFRSTF